MVLQNSGRYRPESSVAGDDGGGGGDDGGGKTDVRLREAHDNDEIDVKYGFERVNAKAAGQPEMTGYLLNMHSNEIVDEDKRLLAAVDFYFITEEGGRFKVCLILFVCL